MPIIPISQLPYQEVYVTGIRGMCQHWHDKSVYNYLERPRPDSGLTLILKGQANYIFPNGNLHVTAGNVVALPEGTHYSVTFHTDDENNTTDTLLVNYRLFSYPYAPVVFAEQPLPLLLDTPKNIYPFFKATVDASMSRNLLYCKETFFHMLGRICKMLMAHANNDPFPPILDYIEDHLGDFPGIPALCSHFAMSQSGIRRLFAEKIGMSPTAYLNKRRIERAKEMLLTSEATTEIICEQLGFYDASHFYKCFKKELNITPGEFVLQNHNS